MNWDKYADKKAKSLVAFEKETVTIKEAIKDPNRTIPEFKS